jgi:type I restriction enzyme, S subunit
MTYPQHSKYKPGGCPWFPSIPVHWRTLPLKWAITFQRGHDLPAEEREDGEVPVVSSGGISDKHSKSSANAPGIVTGRYGSIGEFYLLERDYWPLNTTLFSIDLHGNRAQYLRYMLQHLSPLFVMNAVKSAVPGVDRNDIHPIRTALPPLPEQRTIADFLDRETAAIDALISSKTSLIDRFHEKRRCYIAEVCLRGLDRSAPSKSSGIPTVGRVPRHWTVVRNKMLFREIDERSVDGTEELLTVSHITGVTRRSEKPEVTMFMAESLAGYKRCRRDDLIINTMWAWMGALGVSGSNGIVSPGYNVYRLKQKAVSKFFDLLYRTPQYITEFTRWSKGVWESRLRLYPFEFLQILTPVPPLDEQQVIVDAVERETGGQLKAIATLQTSISKLAEYRSALISAAVTGQIDIRNYHPQEAAALCR